MKPISIRGKPGPLPLVCAPLVGATRETLVAEAKAELDVWGPVAPEALEIMARVKREFDPDGVLNPGRFVGGL